jgi:hypothetical protein
MAPVLSMALRAFVDETVTAAPPMPDRMRDDLRLITWGTQPQVSAEGDAA